MILTVTAEMTEYRLPDRLLALPMYGMLALTREGYRHGVRANVQVRMPQYAVLAVLDQLGPSSQKSVAEATGFHKSDVTKIINGLQARALVRRQEDAGDSRRHRVTLTPKGKRRLATAADELTASMRQFLRGLTDQEYRELQRLLRKAIEVHDPRFRVGAGAIASARAR